MCVQIAKCSQAIRESSRRMQNARQPGMCGNSQQDLPLRARCHILRSDCLQAGGKMPARGVLHSCTVRCPETFSRLLQSGRAVAASSYAAIHSCHRLQVSITSREPGSSPPRGDGRNRQGFHVEKYVNPVEKHAGLQLICSGGCNWLPGD